MPIVTGLVAALTMAAGRLDAALPFRNEGGLDAVAEVQQLLRYQSLQRFGVGAVFCIDQNEIHQPRRVDAIARTFLQRLDQPPADRADGGGLSRAAGGGHPWPGPAPGP